MKRFMDSNEIIEQLHHLIDEATTSTDISYIPSHFGEIKNSLKKLSSEKEEWQVKILDRDLDKQVSFEEQLNIIVPNQHWNDFVTKFKISKPGKIRILDLLQESQEDFEKLREQLKYALLSLLEISEIEFLEDQFNLYRSFFGYTQWVESKSAINHMQAERDVLSLYSKMLKIYGRDRGAIEQLLQAIQEKKMLNTFKGFDRFSFLYGVKVFSDYKKVRLTFETVIGFDYAISQSLEVEAKDPNVTEEILAQLEEQEPSFKIVKNVVFPAKEGFNKSFYRVLKEAIKEKVD